MGISAAMAMLERKSWPSWLVVLLAIIGPIALAVMVAFGVSSMMDLVPYPHTIQGVDAKDVDTKYAILFTVPVVLLAFGWLVWRRANQTARVVFLMLCLPVSLVVQGLLFAGSIAK